MGNASSRKGACFASTAVDPAPGAPAARRQAVAASLMQRFWRRCTFSDTRATHRKMVAMRAAACTLQRFWRRVLSISPRLTGSKLLAPLWRGMPAFPVVKAAAAHPWALALPEADDANPHFSASVLAHWADALDPTLRLEAAAPGSGPHYARWVYVMDLFSDYSLRVAVGFLAARRLPLVLSAAETLAALLGGCAKRDARVAMVREQGGEYDLRANAIVRAGAVAGLLRALAHFPESHALARAAALVARNICAGSSALGADERRRACLPLMPPLCDALAARLPPALAAAARSAPYALFACDWSDDVRVKAPAALARPPAGRAFLPVPRQPDAPLGRRARIFPRATLEGLPGELIVDELSPGASALGTTSFLLFKAAEFSLAWGGASLQLDPASAAFEPFGDVGARASSRGNSVSFLASSARARDKFIAHARAACAFKAAEAPPPARDAPAPVLAALCIAIGNVAIGQACAASRLAPTMVPLLQEAVGAAGEVGLAAVSALYYVCEDGTAAAACAPAVVPALIASLQRGPAAGGGGGDALEGFAAHAETLGRMADRLHTDTERRPWHVHRWPALPRCKEPASARAAVDPAIALLLEAPALLTQGLPAAVAASAGAALGGAGAPAVAACRAVAIALRALAHWAEHRVDSQLLEAGWRAPNALLAAVAAAAPALLDALLALAAAHPAAALSRAMHAPLNKAASLLRYLRRRTAGGGLPSLEWAAPLEGRLRALFAVFESAGEGLAVGCAAAARDTLVCLGFEAPAILGLYLNVLPPAALAARLGACLSCFAASAAACEHDEPALCCICYEAVAAGAAEGPVGLRCGHVFHRRCVVGWAAHETRGYRRLLARSARERELFRVTLKGLGAAHCPMDRQVCSTVAWGGRPSEVRVETPPPEEGEEREAAAPDADEGRRHWFDNDSSGED
jgi:hypothetical protein